MPLIRFLSPDKLDDQHLLADVCRYTAEFLHIPPDWVWAVWTVVGDGAFHHPLWGASESNAPIISVVHRDAYASPKMETWICLLTGIIAERLGCDSEKIFVERRALGPGELFVRGEFPSSGEAQSRISEWSLSRIGVVENQRSEPIDDGWGSIRSRVVLEKALLAPDAVAGLSEFSHLEIIFGLHLVRPHEQNCSSRHPRGNLDLPKVGVLAQRCKDRINRLGVSICALKKIEDFTLEVDGLDAINGSPVFDIKPVFRRFLPPQSEIKEPEWVAEIVRNYF